MITSFVPDLSTIYAAKDFRIASLLLVWCASACADPVLELFHAVGCKMPHSQAVVALSNTDLII